MTGVHVNVDDKEAIEGFRRIQAEVDIGIRLSGSPLFVTRIRMECRRNERKTRGISGVASYASMQLVACP